MTEHLPRPPRERLTGDEQRPVPVGDGHPAVEAEPVVHADVHGGRGRRRVAEDVELAETRLGRFASGFPQSVGCVYRASRREAGCADGMGSEE